jgi:hypothetical protein
LNLPPGDSQQTYLWVPDSGEAGTFGTAPYQINAQLSANCDTDTNPSNNAYSIPYHVYPPPSPPQTLITGVDSGSGSVSPYCPGPSGCSYAVGAPVTVTANPSPNWSFSSWSTESGISCSTASCNFNMPNNAVTLKATFISTPPPIVFSITLLTPDRYSYSAGDTPSFWAEVKNTGSTNIDAYELVGTFTVVDPSGNTIAAGLGYWAYGGGPGVMGVIANTDNAWLIPSNAQGGVYTLKLTVHSQHNLASDQSVTSDQAFSVMSPSPPHFEVSVSPSSVTAHAGDTVTYSVTMSSINYWTGSVTLDDSLTTSGTSVSFSQNPVTLTANQVVVITMTVTLSPSVWLGYSPFVVLGSSGVTQLHSAPAALTTLPASSSLMLDQMSTDKSTYSPSDQITFSFRVTSNSGSYTFRPTVKVARVGEWTKMADYGVSPGQPAVVSITVSGPWPSGGQTWGVTLEGPPPSYSTAYLDTAYAGSFTVSVPSYQLTLQSQTPDGKNDAFILLDGREYRTPLTVSKSGATYSISAYWPLRGFLFDHWEGQGVNFGDTYSQTTTVQVSGQGTIKAVFVSVYLSATTSPFHASLQLGQSVGITVTITVKPATYQRTFVLKIVVTAPGWDKVYTSPDISFTGSSRSLSWPFDGNGVTQNYRAGTYSIVVFLYYSQQQSVANVPVANLGLPFAFSVDTTSYLEVYGSSTNRIVHVHLISQDVDQGKKVSKILYAMNTLSLFAGMVGDAGDMLLGNLGAYMTASATLAEYADYTGHLAHYAADNSYDFVVLQTLGSLGKFYESRLTDLKDQAVEDYVITGLKLAAFVALLGGATVVSGGLLGVLIGVSTYATLFGAVIDVVSYFVPTDLFFNIPDKTVPHWDPIHRTAGGSPTAGLNLGQIAFASPSLQTLPANAIGPDGRPVSNALLLSVSPGQSIRASTGSQISISVQYRITSSEIPGESAQLLLVTSWGSGWPPVAGSYELAYDGVPSGQSEGTATFMIQAPSIPGDYYIWLVYAARTDVFSASTAFKADLMFSSQRQIEVTVAGYRTISPDLIVWRPSSGTWYIRHQDGSSWRQQWGTSNDVPFVGDVDGDGLGDLIVWRPSTGMWYVLLSSKGYSSLQALRIQWGTSGDTPLVGDVDGDGRVDLIVWRPSNGYWYVLQSSTNYSPSQVLRIQWGTSGDKPLVGRFDSDVRADLIVWRESTGMWYVLKSSTGYDRSKAFRAQWGMSGDKPLVGDVDGDGLADLIIWRPSNGYWYALKSTASYSSSTALRIQWGTSTDKPLVGGYDSDGLVDLAVWRPSTGVWYVLKSTASYDRASASRVQWGTSGDRELMMGPTSCDWCTVTPS